MDIRAPKDGVIVSSAEQRLGGAVKSGEEVFGYNTGTVFLGDINNPQNGILFPASPIIKYGDFVLVTTKEGSRLIGVVTNVSKAFSPDIQLANQSIEIKAWDQQHTLRTGMFVNVSLLDQKNQDMARRAWTQDNPTPSASAPPPPPPDRSDRSNGQDAEWGQNPPNTPITIVTPLTSFPTQGPSVNLAEIEKRVRNYNLTAVTQRYTYLQKQLAEKYPNSKSLSLDFNVYTSGGKTYYGGGIAGQLPNLAVELSTGNAYGAAAPVVYSYFLKIANIVTHQKAKQIEFAKIQTELALLGYQTAVFEQVHQAKNAGIDLGAQEQNIALLEQLISDLEMARRAIADRMNVGISTEEQLRAFDDTIAEARAAESTAKENSGKYAVKLNTLTGQKDLHDQVAVALPWEAEFPTISPEQENDWINKLVDANPQIQQAKAEIAAVKQKIKLQKPKGWDANAGGVYTTDAINDSMTEPAFGGGEEYRASLMNPGENAANGITVPLFNGPKKIDDRIIAEELQKKQAELNLRISTLKGELATSVSALRDLSKQIQEADAAYQNALQWWELKARFTGTIYSPQDLVKEREAVNQWAMKKIDLEKQYFQEQENLKKLGVLPTDESLVKDKAMMSDKAQPAGLKSFRGLIWGVVAAVAFSLMPLNAQQGLSDPTREFNAWSSRAELNGNAGPLNDPNPINRMQALDFIEKYQDNKDFIDQLEKIIMNAPPDVKQELLRFMVGRKDVDLRFFIQIINKAEENHNKELVALTYQALDDVLTNNPDRSAHLSPGRDFVASSVYSEVSPEIARKVFLTWLAADPGGSTAKTHFLLGDDKDHYWSSQELAQIYNELNAYVTNHPDDPQADKMKNLAKFIRVSIKRRKALENLDATFTLGPFEQLAGGILNFWNAESRVEIQFWKEQDLRFLNSSQWPHMEGHIAPPLDAKAAQMTQELIDDDPASNTSGPPLYDIFYDRPITNIYFNQLDPAGQLKYIEGSGISELARILNSSTFLRKVILDRLMASRDGRLLVLEVYSESNDAPLLQLIEKSYDWTGIIKEDAGTIEDPAAEGIFRKALRKMYDQTNQDEPLNVLLGLYSATELRLAQEVQDPRGDALKNSEDQRNGRRRGTTSS